MMMNDSVVFSNKPRLRNFVANLPALISGCVWAVLGLFPFADLYDAGLLFVLVSLFVLSLKVENFHAFWRKRVKWQHIALAVVILLLEALLYYRYSSSLSSTIAGLYVSKACGVMGVPNVLSMKAAIPIAALMSVYFLSGFVAYIQHSFEHATGGASSFLTDESKVRRNVICLRLLVVVCFLSLLVSSFSYYVWADPVATLALARLSFSDMMTFIVADVHPPLYYFMLRMVEEASSIVSTGLLFQIVVGKFLTIIAYLLTAGLCWHKLKGSHNPYLREVAILSLFAAPMAFQYGVEVRMYGWALFFVAGVCLYTRDIICGNGGVMSWCWLVFYSVSSAYTHNFSLIAMASAWLYLFIWILLNNRKLVKPCLLSGCVVACAYLPWLIILLKQTAYVSEGAFWIQSMESLAFFDYLCGRQPWTHWCGMLPGLLLLLFVMSLVFANRLKREQKQVAGDMVGIWIALATLMITFAISLLYRPVLANRYLIPCSFVLLLSVVLLWGRMRGWVSVLFVVVISLIAAESCAWHLIAEYTRARHAKTLVRTLCSFEKDAVVYAEEVATSSWGKYHYRTFGYYIDNKIIVPRTTSFLPHELWNLLYPNVQFTDGSSEDAVLRELEEGKTVYYIAFEGGLPESLRPSVQYAHIGDIDMRAEWNFNRSHQFSVFRLKSANE